MRYNIEQVIPHREPMVLIDKLVNYQEEECHCQVTISEQSLFFDPINQGVPSYVGCEYMAQSIAAFAGAHALDANEQVKIGFLLGSRKYKTTAPYFTNRALLDIKVTRLHQEPSGLSVFDCTIYQQQQILASALINVFQPDDAIQFIEESHD